MEEEGFKQGFLVKKGRTSHRWKARWFVLHEAFLAYHRKSDKKTPIDIIKLFNASVVSPVTGYEKRQGIFKLCTHSGRAYLLKAPTNEERDIWTHAIGAAIRQVDGMTQKQFSNATRRLSTRINLSDVLGAMQDSEAGVVMTSCRANEVDYDNCFSGCSVVDWLLRWSFATSRSDAVGLAEDLMLLAHIQPITSSKQEQKAYFIDSNEEFYRFSAWTRLMDLPEDTSSEDSASSIGEESEGDLLDRSKMNKQTKTVKEGFLLKKGYLRNKWKTRRIALKDSPPLLEYYGTSKDSEPIKVIPLNQSKVLDERHEKEFGVEGSYAAVNKRRQNVFHIQVTENKIISFQAADDHIKEDWIKAFKKVCVV